jgi:hypothetical protein
MMHHSKLIYFLHICNAGSLSHEALDFVIALDLHNFCNAGSLSHEAKEVFLAALVGEGLFCNH